MLMYPLSLARGSSRGAAYLVVRFDVELDLLAGEGSYSVFMSAFLPDVKELG